MPDEIQTDAPVMEQATNVANEAPASAPVKKELSLEEQFAALESEKGKVASQLAEIDNVVKALGFTTVDDAGVPAFMKANADSLKAQLSSFDERFKALYNKVPIENASNFLKSLAANFASFGFADAITFSVTFNPKDNTISVTTGRAKSPAATKKEGAAGSPAITSRTSTLNGVSYPSAAAALGEAKKILGLPETFGDGNSAVRVLTSLAKQYPDKIQVAFGS